MLSSNQGIPAKPPIVIAEEGSSQILQMEIQDSHNAYRVDKSYEYSHSTVLICNISSLFRAISGQISGFQ